VGPEQVVPWPAGAAWLEYEPKVAAVLGKELHRAEDEDVRANVFGYTLVNDWSARDASGSPMATSEGLPLAIGPVVVTADELDPHALYLDVRIDGESIAKGNLNGAAHDLFALIGAVSRVASLERGDAFALGPFGPASDPTRQLWPGASVELRAEGIGTLKNRIAAS
ncbi:MAG: hypothetical protein QOE25_695, partial [Actinomycetota bacterium]|nr:hypothetical protein [Actinomycetota bacterium]